jgi:UDPglucose--hexose-1-phosphate uridylyltransferase
MQEDGMPELRQNLATKEWVIIATDRAKRPEQFVQPARERVEDRPAWVDNCPFCPDNEEIDLEQLRLPAEGDWLARVVRNRYPALQSEGVRTRHFEGLNSAIAGVGYHEVVVESRRHNTCPAIEAIDEVERTLLAFQLRGRAIAADPRVDHVVYFKNHGMSAGASLVHPHAQLLGLPVVPYSVRARIDEARRYLDDTGVCVICRMRDEEEGQSVRMVAATPHFSAFVPYAAFSPFHLWVIPRRHASSFLDATADEVSDLAAVLRELLRKLYFGLNDPDYNYVIRSAPMHEHGADYLHWYIAIVPRVNRVAGFELGSGMFINTSLPEESAAFLRDLSLPD